MDIRKWILRILKHGKLTEEELDEARREFRKDRGEIRKLPEPYDIDKARRVQEQTGEKDIADVLIRLGMVGEREVLMAKAQQMNLGFVDVKRVQVDPAAIACVPERTVRDHLVMPIKKDGGTLWLAMANDKNIVALDEVRQATGLRVIPVLAVPGAIEDAIKKYYGQPAKPS